jgi:hypothetical protein
MADKVEPRRVIMLPHPDPDKAKRGQMVKGLIVDFETIKEDWSIYQLGDGTRVRIKCHPTQFNKALDPQTGDVMYKNGQPIYGVQAGIEVIFESAEALIKP